MRIWVLAIILNQADPNAHVLVEQTIWDNEKDCKISLDDFHRNNASLGFADCLFVEYAPPVIYAQHTYTDNGQCWTGTYGGKHPEAHRVPCPPDKP